MHRPAVPQGRWSAGPPASGPTGSELLELLRCPVSGERLTPSGDGGLRAGDRRYPVIDGVPILVGEDCELVTAEDYLIEHRAGHERGARATFSRLMRRATHLGPSITRNIGSADHYAELRRLLLADAAPGRRPRVLVVGGAVPGTGFEALLEGNGIDVLETDLALGPRTKVVCDAHALPFADGSFDAAVCQGVLSVVVDPHQVVAELHRVLVPQGLVYSEVPFMQQVCNGAADFTRWTAVGHARLYRSFDVIASGASGGPGMALAWSLSYFAMSFTGNSHLAHGLVRRLVALISFPLTYIDGYLARQPGGLDAAAGVYLLGRRREQPLDDRAVIAGYAGAVRPSGGLIV
jgi:SAM-dependent methyltransferase